MRVVIQRVLKASVTIEGECVAQIGNGLLVLAGFVDDDQTEDIEWCAKKIAQLRIFDDEQGVMNRSVMDINGELLVVSQFTLHALTKKGNRPSYVKAAGAEIAVPLYERFCKELSLAAQRPVQTGRFGADMAVDLLNSGPVTILIDTKNKE